MPHCRKLICGDCFEVLPKLRGSSVDLIVTDPPYDIVRNEGGGIVNKRMKMGASLSHLQKGVDITKSYDIEGFSDIVSYLQGDNINAYFFCNKRQIPFYLKAYVERLKCKFDLLTWYKQNALPTYSNKYLTDTEYILYFRKGTGKVHPESYEDAKTYYMGYINHKDKKLYGHPTIKPLPLVERLIRNSSVGGDLVLDPFMGSGTTGVACKNLRRGFVGIELYEDYYKISTKRILG